MKPVQSSLGVMCSETGGYAKKMLGTDHRLIQVDVRYGKCPLMTYNSLAVLIVVPPD